MCQTLLTMLNSWVTGVYLNRGLFRLWQLNCAANSLFALILFCLECFVALVMQYTHFIQPVGVQNYPFTLLMLYLDKKSVSCYNTVMGQCDQ